MASPVIFDDGGSTRIKLRLSSGVGAMDDLLDVDPATGRATQTVNRPYTTITLSAIDNIGAPTPVLVAALVAAGDSFTLQSANSQTVTGTFGVAGHLTITLQGTVGNPPMVEAKQFAKKRRYVIANAGAIQQVSVTLGGVTQNFNTSANLYTTVLVN